MCICVLTVGCRFLKRLYPDFFSCVGSGTQWITVLVSFSILWTRYLMLLTWMMGISSLHKSLKNLGLDGLENLTTSLLHSRNRLHTPGTRLGTISADHHQSRGSSWCCWPIWSWRSCGESAGRCGTSQSPLEATGKIRAEREQRGCPCTSTLYPLYQGA